MRGLMGSGKSEWVKRKMIEILTADPMALVTAVSADHFFMVDGKYKFDATRLGEAHSKCLRDYLDIIINNRYEVLFVDNTNISPVEIAPYYKAAQAYGHDVEIINIKCDPALAAARNVHGVPTSKILDKYKQLGSTRLSIDWAQTTVEANSF